MGAKTRFSPKILELVQVEVSSIPDKLFHLDSFTDFILEAGTSFEGVQRDFLSRNHLMDSLLCDF